MLLNEHGEVVEFIQLDFIKHSASAVSNEKGSRNLYLRKKKDIARFQEWLRMHEPQLIVIDASSLESIDFRKNLVAQVVPRPVTPDPHRDTPPPP